MCILKIFLFGMFHTECGERDSNGLEMRKVQELFCYLLLNRKQSHHRETLADLLWNDNANGLSKKYLRKTLWQLQSVLESQTEPNYKPLLLVEPEWIQLNPEANLWIDVAEFEQAFMPIQGVPGNELGFQYAQNLKEAIELYRGDLLEGLYSDWCIYERERFKHIYLAMLDKMMAYCEAHHEYEIGINYGMRALRHDRARERTHRRLMRLLYLVGYRTEALRQYQRCITALDEELGVGPTTRTMALHEKIQKDELNHLSLGLSGVSQSTNIALPNILSHLQELEAAITEVQRQVQEDIQMIKGIIQD